MKRLKTPGPAKPRPEQTLKELKAMTDPQAGELYAHMMESGQLPPPPELCSLTTPELRENLKALTLALTGHAAYWASHAPQGSPMMHFSNGLLYAIAFIGSAEGLDTDPLNILSLFCTWAAGFARDVLGESGLSESEIDTALESPPTSELFARLPDPMARGAAGAALGCFTAGLWMVGAGERDDLGALLALVGRAVAGDDFTPSPGEGIQA